MLLRLRRSTSLLHLPRASLSTLSLSSISSQPTPIQPLTKPQLKTLILSHYTNGKFTNLLQNVVASPSLLLTACQTLNHNSKSLNSTWVYLNFFSIEELSAQIAENRIKIESLCASIGPDRGEPLILPNLKLKVVIEAIRLVLEVIYDDRFVTFCYGGRVNMGRHTAIRYLKNSIENPSWWFTVCFNQFEFGKNNVDKLCLIMGEKIGDNLLIDMIKKLFECQVVKIELGGCYLGRGFPQECALNSILINIYFNNFDKELQDLRLEMNRKSPQFHSSELDSISNNAFYKPSKIYIVRYLDEILLITSGTKMLTMDLKKKVVNFLESDLELKVNKIKTTIHSAVTEKIDFIGFEFQAVPPSILHPPMSEKAVRARKKYLRQKEVRALELRNLRETNRKKLSLKIMKHVFKKVKQSGDDGFKFDFHIENEVRQIFSIWGDEVVNDFLGSLEDRRDWYRNLTTGDFLSLGKIRDQLPRELIESYDNFQEQVEKYLNPVKVIKALEEEEKKEEDEYERKYADRTVNDLTKLCMKVSAPIELIKKAIKLAGFTNNMGRPRPINWLMSLEDVYIIKWYAGVGKRWLDFFCCCHNFKFVKTIVSYHLRFSCLLTLKDKHEATKKETIKHYTKDLQIYDLNGVEEVYFPTEREIKMMGDNNLSDPKPVDGALTMALVRLAYDEPSNICVAHFCDRRDTIIYRIRLMQNEMNLSPFNEKKWVLGMGTIHKKLHMKCVSLCSDHISDLYMGKITLQDVDCTSIVDVD